jgi:hypothetical protein
MRRVTLACTLLLPLVTAGCGGDIQTLLAPTPDPVIVTETFTGTLTRNGAASHAFPINFSTGGDVTAVLRTLAPDDTTVVGFSLGTFNGTSCQAVIANDRATATASLLGRATSSGSLCVRIYDVGTVVDPQDYEIEVTHP